MIVDVKKGSTIPEYATAGSAGADLRASENYLILPGETVVVDVNLQTTLPHGVVGLIRPRSGMASKYNIMLASSGIIDSDYTGRWGVPLINHSDKKYHVLAGDKVAQVIFLPYIVPSFIEVDELKETERVGGYGSTGK